MSELKVLLVDDEVDFTQALGERLELRDYTVNVAGSGEECLKQLESGLPDVVVLDLKMPGLGGIEVLKRIRVDYPDLPVLLLTGYGSTEEGIKGMQLGAADYLMKPLNIDDLISKIHQAVGR